MTTVNRVAQHATTVSVPVAKPLQDYGYAHMAREQFEFVVDLEFNTCAPEFKIYAPVLH